MSIITRAFAEDGSRYEIDLGVCSYFNGFCQIDTNEDASWFGLWTNPEQMVVASYIEGDIAVERGENPADYRAALVRTLLSYGHSNPDRKHAMIDLGISRRAEFRDRFTELGLASYLYLGSAVWA